MSILIDFHTHILPGMDDGSADLAETLELLRLLKQQGITLVGATSHFYAKQDTPENFLRRRAAAAAQINMQDETLPRILLGAEVAYFDGMSSCEELGQLTMGDSKLLLVEMPFDTWSHRMVEEVCMLPINLGVIPVIAHVDRYCRKGQMNTYSQQLLGQGIYFQCNGAAFRSFRRRWWIFQQMKKGNIHFLGSDCHNTTLRRPNMDEVLAFVKKRMGRPFLEQMHQDALELLNIR